MTAVAALVMGAMFSLWGSYEAIAIVRSRDKAPPPRDSKRGAGSNAEQSGRQP